MALKAALSHWGQALKRFAKQKEVDPPVECNRSIASEFKKRRIKTQTVLPCAETAAMLFWALLALGKIAMRKVDGSDTLA